MEARTDRSGLTNAAIVDTALAMARAEGLESLTIGEVAKRLGLSKSGVFSRVSSREALQIAVIEEYDRRFLQAVFAPSMREPRGRARLDALMQRWLEYIRADQGQGCLYVAGAFEYDDREGEVRERLLDGVVRWRQALRRAVQQAIDCGEFAPGTDAEQLAFEIDALITGVMRDTRFIRDPQAPARAWRAWQRLADSARAAPPSPHR